jgi:hypothetical protein
MTIDLPSPSAANRSLPADRLRAPLMKQHHKIIATIMVKALMMGFAGISIVQASGEATAAESSIILAQNGPPKTGGDQSRPPREAVEACSSKAKQDACSFSGRDSKQVEGVCSSPDDAAPLACMPADAPRK